MGKERQINFSKNRDFRGKRGIPWKNGGFGSFLWKNRGLVEKYGFSGLWSKIGVLVENAGFFEKWGFRGFLVNKSGKSREEPGI